MAKRTSLYTDNTVIQIIDPVNAVADTNSTEIDMKGHDEVMLVANAGESADTLAADLAWEFQVQESDTTGTGYTAVANADLVNYVTGSAVGTFALINLTGEDDSVYITAYRGSKRYLRVVANAIGSVSSGMPISVTAIKSKLIKPANEVVTQ